MVIDELEVFSGARRTFDLWEYSTNSGSRIEFNQANTTAIAIKRYREGMKSRFRKLIAIGRLCDPGFVYVR
jgi:hypothetical protein